jgi:hypothetical protein
MKLLLAIACVCLGCASPDLELSSEEQAEWNGGPVADGEVVVIESGWDACLDGAVCWGDLDEDPIDPGDTGGGGPGGGPGGTMDPEPDRNKDRKSCHDWCDWSKRQCIKECKRMHPYPDWDGQNQCLKNRCENHSDPSIGYKSCRSDCSKRFPERPQGPITTGGSAP